MKKQILSFLHANTCAHETHTKMKDFFYDTTRNMSVVFTSVLLLSNITLITSTDPDGCHTVGECHN